MTEDNHTGSLNIHESFNEFQVFQELRLASDSIAFSFITSGQLHSCEKNKSHTVGTHYMFSEAELEVKEKRIKDKFTSKRIG